MENLETRVQARPLTQQEEESRCAAMDQLLRTTEMTLDTCIWMMRPEDAAAFFDRLMNACARTGRRIWIPEEVRLEMEKLTASPKPETAERAREGLDRLNRMSDRGLVDIYGGDAATPAFNDRVLLARAMELRARHRLTVVTQDRKLAADLESINLLQSVRGLRVQIRRVTAACWLGCYVDPQARAGGISRFTAAAAPTEQSDVPIPGRSPQAGDVLTGMSGRDYRLEGELRLGGEAAIWNVEGEDGLVIKTFEGEHLTTHKFAKAQLLASRTLEIESAVLPSDLLVDADGNFVGYAMKRVDGVMLSSLFTTRGLARHAPDWDRRDFAKLAARYVRVVDAITSGGILLGDVSANNVMVGRDAHGRLDPSSVHIVDLDSAQFGTLRTGVFAPDGITPEYAAPELLLEGADARRLRTAESERYSVALLSLQIMLCGVHPFRIRREEDAEDVSLEDAIVRQEFPFGAGEDHRRGTAPSGAEKLWSNVNRPLKEFYFDIFQGGRSMNAPAARPPLAELARRLEYYAEWVADPAKLREYPEIRSLAPERLKPFAVTCARCAKQFPSTQGVQHAGGWICPECLDAPSGKCVACAAPLMTTRELIEQKRAAPPRLCPACVARANKAIDHYTVCRHCGKPFPLTRGQLGAPEVCTHCGRGQADSPAPSESAPTTPAAPESTPTAKRTLLSRLLFG